MDKYPLLETLFELHKRDHYVDKLLSTFHFVFVSEILYKVKHTNGQVIFRMSFTFIKFYIQINRLIDWSEADNGFGEFIITHVEHARSYTAL